MIRAQFSLDLHDEMVVDNFAGGGGASTGIELALGRCVDIAINHDPEALALHEANHPQTRHFCEDVFKVDPVEATKGRPVGVAWFSPDCKHFSKAKGGKPKSKKIRGLAWVMVKWAATVAPRVMFLENVEEFKTWGPLLPDGTACPRRKGKTFRNFVRRLENLGYVVDTRELRACDYGAPTIRKRLFLIARRDGKPIVWPQPTHGAPGSEGVLTGKLKPWRTATECIDWSIPCKSIFERSRPLAEATLRRIARGIQRYVIDAKKPFIVRTDMQSASKRNGVHSVDEPLRTATSCGGFAAVTPILTEHANASAQRNFPADEPLRTQCGEVKGGHFAVVAPTLVVNTTGHPGGPVTDPHHTICAEGTHHALVGATLIHTAHGERDSKGKKRGKGEKDIETPLPTTTGSNDVALISANLIGAGGPAYSGKPTSVEAPIGSQTAENHKALVSAFLAKHYGDRGQAPGSEMNEPVSTVTSTDHNALVAATLVGCGGRAGQSRPRSPGEPMATATSKADGCVVTSNLVALHGDHDQDQSVTEPLDTVCAGGNHHAEVRALLIKYYGEGGQDQNITDPMHTVTSKDRIGLVIVEGEEYLITDIGMRMLEPHELYAAQGFPADYIIAPEVNGRPLPKYAQVRMCGNSVCPPLAQALVAANVPELSCWQKGERRAA